MSEELDKALRAREDFIRLNPEAAKYQAAIDQLLAPLTNPVDRLAALLMKINQNMDKMKAALNDINRQ